MRRTVFSALMIAAPLLSQPATEPAATPIDSPPSVQEAILNAPVAEVWKVWSTSAGYKHLGVAQADVDLRIGGLIRSHYSAKGALGDEETIENRILAFEPQRMIAFRIERPPKSFPFKEAWKTTWTVVTFTDLGDGRTKVRGATMGYGNDEESATMRKFFDAGNASTLKVLQNYFDSLTAKK
ncbi:MAG TPA: SRPBCC domain-containing protein [Bryobacteraceae bacterium]|jgi:uncharacterized protein YndB with AHSA1/START domain